MKIEIANFLRQYANFIRGADDAKVVADDKKYVDQILNLLHVDEIGKALVLRDLYYGWNHQGIEYVLYE